MGMFDSIYDGKGREWQTKALALTLARFNIGDTIPGPPLEYQMEVLGGDLRDEPPYTSFATIKDGRVETVPARRNRRLPLLTYVGYWEQAAAGDARGHHEEH